MRRRIATCRRLHACDTNHIASILLCPPRLAYLVHPSAPGRARGGDAHTAWPFPPAAATLFRILYFLLVKWPTATQRPVSAVWRGPGRSSCQRVGRQREVCVARLARGCWWGAAGSCVTWRRHWNQDSCVPRMAARAQTGTCWRLVQGACWQLVQGGLVAAALPLSASHVYTGGATALPSSPSHC